MGWLGTSIEIFPDGIRANRPMSKQFMLFDDIDCIYAEKGSNVTYDELFLIIQENDDSQIVAGELDKGFDQLNQTLSSRLLSFPSDWRPSLEQSNPGVRKLIWSRR